MRSPPRKLSLLLVALVIIALMGTRLLRINTPASDESSQPASPSLSMRSVDSDEHEQHVASVRINTDTRAATDAGQTHDASTHATSDTRENTTSRPDQAPNQTNSDRTQPEAGESDSDTPRLSQRVYEVIDEVNRRQVDNQWEEALNEMNALYLEYETLNTFEQITLLNFYTNVLIRMEMWDESIVVFNQILEIPGIRPDVGLRALLSLGQIHSQQGEHALAISYLESWQALAANDPVMPNNAERVAQLLAASRQSIQ